MSTDMRLMLRTSNSLTPSVVLTEFSNDTNLYSSITSTHEGWSGSYVPVANKKISNIEIPMNSGDFSLISRRAVNYLNAMPEESRFLRGMRSWIGFKQVGIEIERDQRFAGTPKYSFGKLLKLAFNGIFNFSEYPIKFVFSLGFVLITLQK